MARFDLYNNPSSGPRANSPYLLDVQSDYLGSLLSRVVIPLTRVAGNYTSDKVAQDLAPIIEIGGEKFILETPFLGAIRASELGPATGTLNSDQGWVLAALDRLVAAY
jgi:toxin CcdB